MAISDLIPKTIPTRTSTVKTAVETLEPVKVKLSVEVEPKRVKQALDQAARELAKQVTIPGFRPGKAPRRLLEQRLGEGVVTQQAMDNVLSDYYAEALQAEELEPVAQPEVEVDSFDETDGCVFTATLEIRPSLDAPDHTGIAVTHPDWEVDEQDVDEQLEQLRERFAEVDEVERPAAQGDLITIDLDVEVDGTTLESAAVQDALYEVGSGGVTPKLDEEAVGKQAGDTFSYTDTLPEDYPQHGGAEATFHVTVKDVREKTLPELDDDFATTASGFDTLDELKDDVRRSLLARSIEQARHQLRGQILEAYVARVDVPLPPAMIEEEVQQRSAQLDQQAEQYGLTREQVLEAQGMTAEEFEETTRQQAEQGVKAQLVLDALARELEIDLDPADLDAEITRHAQQHGMQPEQIAQILQEQGSLPALVGDILRRKTIDAIVDAADIDGGPSDEVLIDVGLKADPQADEGDDEASGIVVPGQDDDTSGDPSQLIVPGRD